MATVTHHTNNRPTTEHDPVHEETCSSMTACDQRIGSWAEGWDHEGWRVTCPECLSAIRASAMYQAGLVLTA